MKASLRTGAFSLRFWLKSFESGNHSFHLEPRVGPGCGQINPLRQQGKVAGPLGGEDTVPALGHLGPDLEDGTTLKI